MGGRHPSAFPNSPGSVSPSSSTRAGLQGSIFFAVSRYCPLFGHRSLASLSQREVDAQKSVVVVGHLQKQ
jgi:hypothetical protein